MLKTKAGLVGIIVLSVVLVLPALVQANAAVSGSTIKPEENFTGSGDAVIFAYLGNETMNQGSSVTVFRPPGIVTKQHKAVINRPVKWVKKIDAGTADMLLELPKEAENITIKTGSRAQEALEEAGKQSRVEIPQAGSIILGNAIADMGNSLLGWLFSWLKPTGKIIEGAPVVEETNEAKIVDIRGIVGQIGETEIAVEYYTQAPESKETNVTNEKQIEISALDKLNYTDILAYTSIDAQIPVNSGRIKLYWNASHDDALMYGYIQAGEANTGGYSMVEVPFDEYDLDGDGYADYIEWNVPHLSIQSYSLIINSNTIFTNTTLDGSYTHLTINSASTNPPYDSLVGYWNFDADKIGSFGNNTGSAWTTGKVGNAGYFDGAGDYVDIPASTSFDTQNLTISAWVYSNTYTSNMFIFEKGNVNTQYSLFFSGGLIFRTYNSAGTGDTFTTTLATAGISNGNWYNIVAVYNGTGKEIYVNGVWKNSKAYSQTLKTGLGTAERIGAYGGSSQSYYFNGSIDEVKIFNRSLSATEISNLYNNESTGINQADLDRTGLVGEWKLNETSGVTASDNSGLGNTGTWTFTKPSYDFSANNNDGTSAGQTVTNSIGCIYDDCLQLDGTGDYISLTNPISSGSYSVSAWSYRKFNNTYAGIVSDRNIVSGLMGIDLRFQADVLNCWLKNSSGSIIQAQSTQSNYLNTWQHYACVFNGTNLILYVNGVAKTTAGVLSGTPNFLPTLLIGAEYSTAYFFNGTIDEVMIFNTSLTDAQISAIYNNQSARFVLSGTDSIQQFNITAGENTVNFSLQNYERKLGSNISARLGQWDVSLGYNNSDMNSSANGLVSYYHFDENAWTTTANEVKDAMGLNNGTSVGNANTSLTNYPYSRVGSFDGVNDRISVLDSPSLDFPVSGTVTMWVKQDTAVGSWDMPMWRGGATATDKGYDYEFGTGSWTSSIANGTASKSCTFSASPLSGWNMVSITFDTTTNKLICWVNGLNTSAGTDITGFGGIDGTNSLNFGAASDNNYDFNGSIDEVMIFNRTLTQAEITELYVKGRALFNNYTAWQNLTGNSGDNLSSNQFSISTSTTNILPEVQLLGGTSNFYSPLVIATTTTPMNLTVFTPSSSCTYSGSGDWNILCSDNCLIAIPFNVGGNKISVKGTGYLTLTANINNFASIFIAGDSASSICQVICNGGCFVR